MAVSRTAATSTGANDGRPRPLLARSLRGFALPTPPPNSGLPACGRRSGRAKFFYGRGCLAAKRVGRLSSAACRRGGIVDASDLKSVGRETSRAGSTPAVGTKSVVAKGRLPGFSRRNTRGIGLMTFVVDRTEGALCSYALGTP